MVYENDENICFGFFHNNGYFASTLIYRYNNSEIKRVLGDEMAKKDKTNVMRVFEQRKVDYTGYQWEDVKKLEVNSPIYKTLVTQGKSGDHYVFVVPVDKELQLKKAAKAVGEKNIHMIKEKDLLPLTGYVHGGCSPIGMKKQFITVLDETARDHEKILFSGGKVGFSVEVNPRDLVEVIEFKLADIATEGE